MLYLMQLAIYSGVNTVPPPVMLVAMLKDGLEYVTPRLADIQHIPVCMCWMYVSRFPGGLYGTTANTLTLYGREIFRNEKKKISIALSVWGVFC